MIQKSGIVEGFTQASKEENKEQLYIGCKIIKAKPMTRDDFLRKTGQPFDDNSEDAPGYSVEYPDSYVSWSPQWVFENAYRKVTEGELEMFKK